MDFSCMTTDEQDDILMSKILPDAYQDDFSNHNVCLQFFTTAIRFDNIDIMERLVASGEITDLSPANNAHLYNAVGHSSVKAITYLLRDESVRKKLYLKDILNSKASIDITMSVVNHINIDNIADLNMLLSYLSKGNHTQLFLSTFARFKTLTEKKAADDLAYKLKQETEADTANKYKEQSLKIIADRYAEDDIDGYWDEILGKRIANPVKQVTNKGINEQRIQRMIKETTTLVKQVTNKGIDEQRIQQMIEEIANPVKQVICRGVKEILLDEIYYQDNEESYDELVSKGYIESNEVAPKFNNDDSTVFDIDLNDQVYKTAQMKILKNSG